METVIRRIVAYLSLIVVVLYVVTGYGMTKSEIVTGLTFGLLDKSLSRTIHFGMIIPLVILLVAHIFLSCGGIRFFKREEECKISKPVVKKKKKR